MKTAIIAAAPLPALSAGSQTVVQGVAGNVGTLDGRAIATWRPGPSGSASRSASTHPDQSLGLLGSGVALSVPGLPSTGFKWPVEVDYAAAAPVRTVLGYSTDGTVFSAVPELSAAALPRGQDLGAYLTANGTASVLTRSPLQLSLFPARAWGDPTYTSSSGPSLTQQTPFNAFVRASDRTVLVLTRLAAAEQTRLTAAITSPTGKAVPILPKGSVLGSPLPAGRPLLAAQAERDRPGLDPRPAPPQRPPPRRGDVHAPHRRGRPMGVDERLAVPLYALVVVVGLLQPGEMGATIGNALVAAGHEVLWASEGRSDASRARAEKFSDAGTVAALAARAEAVFSVVPPHAALDTARALAGYAGIYVDANAVAPATAREVGSRFARFVDGGIIGGPPDPRLYLSGEEAGTVAALFAGSPVDAQ